MGNIVSAIYSMFIIYYLKARNRLLGKGYDDHHIPEEKKEDTLGINSSGHIVDDTVIAVKKDNNSRNEYQLLKTHEEYEYLNDEKSESQIEEISKEIKNVNIEFENGQEKEGVDQEGLDNLDDLKKEILSEHEDGDHGTHDKESS
jgi:hypothetical protein